MKRFAGYRVTAITVAAIAAGCATHVPMQGEAGAWIRVTADDPGQPSRVRFEVPTASILGMPGPDAIPVTMKARIATRELAARELAARGYCPNGFVGPEGIFFAEGDRGRSAFVVRCRA